MICAKCGTENSPEHQFCVYCGYTLSVPPPEPTRLPGQSGDAFSVSAGEAHADSLSGRTIDGKYRLESKLGVGGMGSVYLATRLHIGDKVAVKVLHGDRSNDPHAGERFRLEAQTAARLKHPNAVSIYDYGVAAGGLRYLVMELVEGRSLRQIISQNGPLPLPAVAEVVSQVCAALDEAHRQGIVHRDIKPDNIVVQDTPAGMRIKVLDFGIAKLRDLAASNLTKAGSVMGTPRYMSPEQCMGEELDGRSDIYSLGIVLYEMICGIVPFTAPTSTAVAVQQVTQAPPPLSRINSFVPPAVEAVVLRSLEKKPEARPHTAGAFAQELSTAIHGRPPAQPAQTMPLGAMSATGQNNPVSTSGVQQTMMTIPSLSGSRELIQPGFSPGYTGEAATAGSHKSNLPLLLTVGGLCLLIGAGIVGIALMLRSPDSEASVNTETTRQTANKKSADNRTVQAAPAPSQSPSATSAADEEFNRLREMRINGTPAQFRDIKQALEEAEERFPTDYRFPYEQAKLLVQSPEHHEAFEVLYEAGRTAIKNGQSERMLSNLTEDGAVDFRRLSRGHHEWEALQDGLMRRDATALSEVGHHH